MYIIILSSPDSASANSPVWFCKLVPLIAWNLSVSWTPRPQLKIKMIVSHLNGSGKWASLEDPLVLLTIVPSLQPSCLFLCVWFSRQDFCVLPSPSLHSTGSLQMAALITSVHCPPLYGALRLKTLLLLAHLTKTHNRLDEFHSVLIQVKCLAYKEQALVSSSSLSILHNWIFLLLKSSTKA